MPPRVPEDPMPGQLYRLAIDPMCPEQGRGPHGAYPAVNGQLVRVLYQGGNAGHNYCCELLTGSEEPTGFIVNGKQVSVRGSKQYFAPHELRERDMEAEIAAIAAEEKGRD